MLANRCSQNLTKLKSHSASPYAICCLITNIRIYVAVPRCICHCQLNVDNNVVGWFKSTRSRGAFCDLETVQVQYEYQHKLGSNAVVLIYDPILSSSGTLSLKVCTETNILQRNHSYCYNTVCPVSVRLEAQMRFPLFVFCFQLQSFSIKVESLHYLWHVFPKEQELSNQMV